MTANGRVITRVRAVTSRKLERLGQGGSSRINRATLWRSLATPLRQTHALQTGTAACAVHIEGSPPPRDALDAPPVRLGHLPEVRRARALRGSSTAAAATVRSRQRIAAAAPQRGALLPPVPPARGTRPARPRAVALPDVPGHECVPSDACSTVARRAAVSRASPQEVREKDRTSSGRSTGTLQQRGSRSGTTFQSI